MSSSNLRLIGSNISRFLRPNGAKLTSNLAAVATIRRDLHNRPLNQQVTSTSTPIQDQFVPPPLAPEGVFKLEEVKVFQDEQIIQLSFKNGQTVNYTMSWLRNLCSCPGCMSNKFHHSPTHSGLKAASLVDGQLSVARFSSSEDELLIEWLDTSYKSHVSMYNLKYLNMYANNRN